MSTGTSNCLNSKIKKNLINENEKLSRMDLNFTSSIKLLTIGSRDSKLAMTQTYLIRDTLKEYYPEMKFKIYSMKTKGDLELDKPLSQIGSKSLFTKELEEDLLNKTVDIVVHSLKDLPTTLPDGLVIGCVTDREDPSDAAILHKKYSNSEEVKGLKDLPENSVIGTSSLRRIAQLKRKYPKLLFESIRGNLNTRLAKLDDHNNFDAIILAAAGVIRMGWKDRISQYLNTDECMYAVGQGALAIECRENDDATLSLLAPLNDCQTLFAISAERALMMSLEGGCSVPLAVDCQIEDGMMTLKGGVWSLDGSEEIIETVSDCIENDNELSSGGESSQCAKVSRICPKVRCGLYAPRSSLKKLNIAHKLGVKLANKMIDMGAREILAAAKAANTIIAPNVPPTKKTANNECNKNLVSLKAS